MKKYERVRICFDKWLRTRPKEPREIIFEYAKKGYRYVKFTPASISPNLKIREWDLLFEKDLLSDRIVDHYTTAYQIREIS